MEARSVARTAGQQLLLGLLCTVPLVSQTPPGMSGGDPCVSPLIAGDHVAVRRAERLQALGLVPEHLPAQQAVPLHDLLATLRLGAERAANRDPALARLTGLWIRELEGEIRTPTCEPGGIDLLSLSAGAGFRSRAGAGGPGLGQWLPDRTGTLPLPDISRPLVGSSVMIGVGDHVAVHAAPWADSEGVHVDALDLTAGWRNLTLSVGRGPVGYGAGVSGSVVLSTPVGIDRVQVQTARPIRPGGPLRPLGQVAFQSFLGRMWEERHPGDPYFWGGSLTVQPHRRAAVSIHRAALFGGDPDGHPVTVRNVFYMMVGRLAGYGFEDQIVSLEGRFHLPTESVVPLTAYVEWGAEDGAGAWRDVPGRVIGLRTPALPGLPEVAVGAEYVSFGSACCGNPPWFRHWSFPGAWASRDRTLAHPLGGDGREIALHTQVDLPGTGLRIEGTGFRRDRGEENLFSPEREGSSLGGRIGIGWRPRSDAAVDFGFQREAGDAWAERAWEIRGRFFF